MSTTITCSMPCWPHRRLPLCFFRMATVCGSMEGGDNWVYTKIGVWTSRFCGVNHPMLSNVSLILPCWDLHFFLGAQVWTMTKCAFLFSWAFPIIHQRWPLLMPGPKRWSTLVNLVPWSKCCLSFWMVWTFFSHVLDCSESKMEPNDFDSVKHWLPLFWTGVLVKPGTPKNMFSDVFWVNLDRAG